MSGNLKILAFGAHPDDCDIKFGGMALLYARMGHEVKFVSLTNGDAGHFAMGGGPLAVRRLEEARRSAAISGVTYETLDNHDGGLEPTLENRMKVVRIIREFAPDLIVAHRPNDYHPDHRYASMLVQDAAYTVTVPNTAPLTPHLRRNPSVAYMSDGFRRPYPFTPDVVVDIDECIGDKMRMIDCFDSQVYEWIPYNQGVTDVPPADEPEKRLEWLTRQWAPLSAEVADRHRAKLIELYGDERGSRVRHAEALEICEYGAPVTPERFPALFPFYAPGAECRRRGV